MMLVRRIVEVLASLCRLVGIDTMETSGRKGDGWEYAGRGQVRDLPRVHFESHFVGSS